MFKSMLNKIIKWKNKLSINLERHKTAIETCVNILVEQKNKKVHLGWI